MSASTQHPNWYYRPEARDWTAPSLPAIKGFHATLPGYVASPLVELPTLAAELGVGRVFLKDESARLGLPAFKILGASYAVSRALSARFGTSDRALSLDELRTHAAEHGRPTLFAATDGNHGRAVAHMARLIDIPAQVYVPVGISSAAKEAIAAEGAKLVELDLEYDDVVAAATDAAAAAGADAVLVQDTAWPGYEEIPQWIVDGYATLFEEIDEQLSALGVCGADLLAVPVGVGSLAQAAVRHARADRANHGAAGHSPRTSVLSVEADRAPSIIASLAAGSPVSVDTEQTIMAGLNCGTVSANAWPYLHDGVDAAVTVSDEEATQAVHDLEGLGVDSGPCGASTLAGARRALAEHRDELGLGQDAVIVLLSTESRAANPLPAVNPAPASSADTDLLTRWRHDLHGLAETAHTEVRTSAYIADALRSLGLEVETGIGGTGVVGTLRLGDSDRAIGLRADMDALPLLEQTGLPYASQTEGTLHACGHDGHMTMVLGAAAALAESAQSPEQPALNGTVRFVFQPAEEPGTGAAAMIADGLFDRFPVDAMYGLHNIPGLPAGQLATREGAIMAGEDNFTITVTGRGGHASAPHLVVDPLTASAEIILALQTIVARSVDPLTPAVVSCTNLVTDGARNAIPTTVTITGDARNFDPEVSELIEARMRSLSTEIAAAYGATAEVKYTREFAPTINNPEATAAAISAARTAGGSYDPAGAPIMGSEDFGLYANHVPANFTFIGSGPIGDRALDSGFSAPLHSHGYDFNDAILPIGVQYYVNLVRQHLA